MYKKTIKFTDYNGVEREEDFFFHLSQAEVLEMDLTTKGGMIGMMEQIIKTRNVPSLITIFKEIICKSYGVKSPDGREFIKNPEVLAEFVQTEAYSNLFIELATDTDAAIEFFNNIVPKVDNMSEIQVLPAP